MRRPAPSAATLRHLWLAALLLAFFAQALFLFRVGVPNQPVFDEVHYVKAARILGEMTGPANIEHPLLGKMIILAGIKLFGDTGFGWRFFSTLAGTGTMLGVFAITWLLTGRVRPSVMAAIFSLTNFLLFVQARIAMLDGFMAVLVMSGLAATLWAMRGTRRGETLARLVLAGAFFGLGVGTKWAALPFIGLAGLLVIVAKAAQGKARGGAPAGFAGIGMAAALAVLGSVSALAYVATFAPAFFYSAEPLTAANFIAFHERMYAQQTQVLPPHPYQSVWWSWPLDLRPVWYLYEPVDGVQRGILLVGNPVILWGGLLAVAACLYGWWKHGTHELGIAALLWLGSIGMWVVIPKKIGFFYYYYLPSLFLCVALALAFAHFGQKRFRHADLVFGGISLAVFAYFFPILSAAALPEPQAFQRWMLLSTWP